MGPNNGLTECYGCTEGNVTVNSRQIMDHAEVSQPHSRQMALQATATARRVSYGGGWRPAAGLFVSSLQRRVTGAGDQGSRPARGSAINLPLSGRGLRRGEGPACLPAARTRGEETVPRAARPRKWRGRKRVATAVWLAARPGRPGRGVCPRGAGAAAPAGGRARERRPCPLCGDPGARTLPAARLLPSCSVSRFLSF